MSRTIVNALDASRMTAPTSRETTSRVSQYFGDAGPFSYQKVRKLTPVLLSGAIDYGIATAGIQKIRFDLARNQNLDVAKLVSECDRFRGKDFYALSRIFYTIDRQFSVSMRPETVVSIDGVPNLIFLQPRKNPTPWAYNPRFLRRILDEAYIPDYYEIARYWLVDTEADENGNRHLKLVDLQAVTPMDDREFNRRIASLRGAWRLHLARRPKSPRKPGKPDDRQQDLGFGDPKEK